MPTMAVKGVTGVQQPPQIVDVVQSQWVMPASPAPAAPMKQTNLLTAQHESLEVTAQLAIAPPPSLSPHDQHRSADTEEGRLYAEELDATVFARSTLFCSACGIQLDGPSVNFCPFCGAAVA